MGSTGNAIGGFLTIIKKGVMRDLIRETFSILYRI
jgi:hypothetical protein